MKIKKVGEHWYVINQDDQPVSLGYDTKQQCWAKEHWKYSKVH